MANYLYNGVELPDINEIWDREKYPYATYVGRYLYFHTDELYVGDGKTKGTGGELCAYWLNNSKEFEYSHVSADYDVARSSLPNWTSYDILNEDGTLYLGATVPLPTIGKTWRYNGVELPALPEWDAQTYPYAVIVNYNNASYPYYQYELVVVSERPEYSRIGDSDLFHVSVENDEALCKGYFYMSEYPDEGWFDSARIGFASFDEKWLNWTNSNILREDGSVLLQASQPIPVGTFPCPEVYVPYVNTAKKIYEQYAGIGVETKVAVAENQNYISVHMLTDDFKLVTYDRETTIYTATGIAFVTYDKRTDKWDATPVDNTTTTSEGSRYLKHWVWSEVDVTWYGSTVFTNQEGWYYNSVKFPELPEVDGYSYKVLCSGNISELASLLGLDINGPMYVLSLVDQKMYYTSDVALGFNANWNYKNYVIVADADACAAINSALGQDILVPGEWCFVAENINPCGTDESLSAEGLFWTNTDILNENGELHISASEPVHVTYVVEYDDDVTSYDVLSFQIGLALGLCGKGIPDNLVVIGGDDSGMYSYNGVILPPLPDYWDKNQFTHRLLVVDNSDDKPYYLLISSENPMRVVNVDSDGLLEFDYNGLDTRTGNCVYIEDADLATSYGVEVGVWDGAGSGMVYGDQGTVERFYELVWSDYDVKRSDGSVYLAKSEPKSVLKEVF